MMQFLSRAECDELKAAGFPQDAYFWWQIDTKSNKAWITTENAYSPTGLWTTIACPTLDELITDLGEDFDYVQRCFDSHERDVSKQVFFDATCLNQRHDIAISADTPLQAVRALWLAVKGKKDT